MALVVVAGPICMIAATLLVDIVLLDDLALLRCPIIELKGAITAATAGGDTTIGKPVLSRPFRPFCCNENI